MSDFVFAYIQGGPKVVSYSSLSISSLNMDQFSQFLPVDFVRNLLLSNMHTTLIISSCKT